MNRRIYRIQLIPLIGLLLFTMRLNASLKIKMNNNYKFAHNLNYNHAEEVDSVLDNNEKGSILYPFNPFIAIPASFVAGLICGGILMKISEEDPPSPYSSVTSVGVGALGGFYLGFAIGFTGSLAAFIIIAHYKGKKLEEKSSTSSFDFSVTNHQVPVKSRIYFLNYKYHF